MSYYQEIVGDFLHDDPANFVHNECTVQLTKNAPKGSSWICDVVTVNFREKTVYLCEVTYAKGLQALITRLRAWDKNWTALCQAIHTDFSIPSDWQVKPRVFIPEHLKPIFAQKLCASVTSQPGSQAMPEPEVIVLEAIVPWREHFKEELTGAPQKEGV